MVEIYPYNFIDKKYPGKGILKQDACQKPTVAVIYNGATMIPLCKDCLSKMNKEMKNLVVNEGEKCEAV